MSICKTLKNLKNQMKSLQMVLITDPLEKMSRTEVLFKNDRKEETKVVPIPKDHG